MNEDVELVIHIRVRKPEISGSYNLTNIGHDMALQIVRFLKDTMSPTTFESVGDITTEVTSTNKYVR
jgi:hypothetical protein